MQYAEMRSECHLGEVLRKGVSGCRSECWLATVSVCFGELGQRLALVGVAVTTDQWEQVKNEVSEAGGDQRHDACMLPRLIFSLLPHPRVRYNLAGAHASQISTHMPSSSKAVRTFPATHH